MEAFNTFYWRFNDMIFSAAIVYVKDVDTARDIVQQVFVKLWEKRAMAVNIDNFQNYIVVTSRNLIYDRFRKANTEMKMIAELAKGKNDISMDGATLAEKREYTRIIAAAIAQLPPQQKKIYLMVQEEQLSYKEVASGLGLSVFTVKRHLELARHKVREYVIQNTIK
jgi:RNA polymerase sigma-70 factor (ECF subfamily)